MKNMTKLVLTTLAAAPASAAYVPGDLVDDFTLMGLDGEEHSLSDLRGRVVLITFFTTWCIGCNEEAPYLQTDFWEALRPIGLTVLGIDSAEAPPLVQGWADALGLDYPIWLTPTWTLFEHFAGAVGMPYNAVIDPDGVLRFARTGFEHDAVMDVVETWLPSATPQDTASWSGVKNLFR